MAKDNQTYREDEGTPTDRYTNNQTKQPSTDLAPADGGDGFVGSNTGSGVGLSMVQGKKGSVTSRPIWSEQSSFTSEQDNTGSTGNVFPSGGQDSTDEYASYKKIQTDEGLPQTYRNSVGAGDAGPAGSDEPDANMGTNLNIQSHPSPSDGDASFSDMPQTEFTHNDGGGAPRWKK